MPSFAPRFRPKSLFRWRDRRRQAQTPRNNRGSRFRLELLEDRQLLSNFTVTDGADTTGSSTDVTLRYAITQAISDGGSSTIGFSSTMTNLTNNTITLTTNDPSGANVYGPTAFVISGANITIDGSGDPGLILSGGGTMRLFAVASSGTLTLEDLTALGRPGGGRSRRYQQLRRRRRRRRGAGRRGLQRRRRLHGRGGHLHQQHRPGRRRRFGGVRRGRLRWRRRRPRRLGPERRHARREPCHGRPLRRRARRIEPVRRRRRRIRRRGRRRRGQCSIRR